METYDLIVVGVGGMGSAICDQAALRGLKVLGLEQFTLANDLGSSHGQTRAIRQAYFEKPEYVPFCKRSVALWRDLEKRVGQKLMILSGIALYLPSAGGKVKTGLLDSANKHNISLESFNSGQAKSIWPYFDLQNNFEVFYEPEAGYLLVEDCVKAHLISAQDQGALIQENTTVLGWKEKGSEIRVQTNQGEYLCKRIAVAGGAWNTQLLPTLPLKIHRVQSAWFEPQGDPEPYETMPVWITEQGGNFIYGFPMLDKRGVKAAFHAPGKLVNDLDAIDREKDEAEAKQLATVASSFLPGLKKSPSETSVCLYTMTPDEDFILDRLGENIAIAAGFSGHGFKFAPAIGEHVIELLFESKTSLDGKFLGLKRLGVRN